MKHLGTLLKNKRGALALVSTVILLVMPPVYAGSADENGKNINWDRWRGPNRDGVSTETGWDPEFLKKPIKINWKKNVGRGYSNVSISGDFLYTMGHDVSAGKNIIYCLDIATGKEVWRYSYKASSVGNLETGDYDRSKTSRDSPNSGDRMNIGPRATPTVHGGMVYTLGQDGDFLCNDALTGKLVWQRQVTREFKAFLPVWKFTSSVNIDGDRAVINAGSCGLALNRSTGEVIWSGGSGTGNYPTPLSYSAMGKARYAVFGNKDLHGVDAESGKVLWTYPWQAVTDDYVNAADPLLWKDGILFLVDSCKVGCALVDVSRDSPVTLWRNMNLKSEYATPVIIGNYIYGIHQYQTSPGTLVCLDIRDGSEQWGREYFCHTNFSATKEYLIVMKESGELCIVKASPDKYEKVSFKKKILGRKCATAPVLCRSTLYIRNDKGDLISIDVSKNRKIGLKNYYYYYSTQIAIMVKNIFGGIYEWITGLWRGR